MQRGCQELLLCVLCAAVLIWSQRAKKAKHCSQGLVTFHKMLSVVCQLYINIGQKILCEQNSGCSHLWGGTLVLARMVRVWDVQQLGAPMQQQPGRSNSQSHTPHWPHSDHYSLNSQLVPTPAQTLNLSILKLVATNALSLWGSFAITRAFGLLVSGLCD